MTLVLPPSLTASAQNLRHAAHRRGLHTIQLPTFEVPAGMQADYLHAGPTFADAVAPLLGIAPLEAPPDWLTRLPREFTRREITLVTIGEAYELRRPAFIKSPNDKNIPAMIYTDGSHLPGPDAIDRRTPVLVSDIVGFTAEYRLHLLDGAVHSGSQYAEQGRPHLGPLSASALAFGADLLAGFGHMLPTAIVVDVGAIDRGWAVIEANAAWASGPTQQTPTWYSTSSCARPAPRPQSGATTATSSGCLSLPISLSDLFVPNAAGRYRVGHRPMSFGACLSSQQVLYAVCCRRPSERSLPPACSSLDQRTALGWLTPKPSPVDHEPATNALIAGGPPIGAPVSGPAVRGRAWTGATGRLHAAEAVPGASIRW